LVHDFFRDETLYTVEVSGRGGMRTVRIGEEAFEVDAHVSSEHSLSLCIDGKSVSAAVVRRDGRIFVHVNGESFCFTYPGLTEDACGARAIMGEAGCTVKAPMPGSVLKIPVKEGERVEEGRCVAIVEAMKMETELRATVDGIVKSIHVEEGEQVDAGEILIELEETETAED